MVLIVGIPEGPGISKVTKLGILNRIVYPSGGHSLFTYGMKQGGGVHIELVENYDGSTLVERRAFTYVTAPLFRQPLYYFYLCSGTYMYEVLRIS